MNKKWAVFLCSEPSKKVSNLRWGYFLALDTILHH